MCREMTGLCGDDLDNPLSGQSQVDEMAARILVPPSCQDTPIKYLVHM